jgi:hypothetical protein
MNGYKKAMAPVSASADPAVVGALGGVSGNVLGLATGYALGAGAPTGHDGEPVPAFPPPPLPGQAPNLFLPSRPPPSPGLRPGLCGAP